jgi:GTP pyrophosphokinase
VLCSIAKYSVSGSAHCRCPNCSRTSTCRIWKHCTRRSDSATSAQLAGAIQRLQRARDARVELPQRPRAAPKPGAVVKFQGIGDLLSTYAKCCKPVPPEDIVGYITVGRGVSIHARSCANFARISAKSPDRVLTVSWGDAASSHFPVDIDIEAFDRNGLLRDVSAALADAKISIQGIKTRTDERDNVARMRLAVNITGLPQLSGILARIAQVPNVISARRAR